MEPAIASVPLPLRLGPMDHYTLIVPDARAAASFHVEVLGFTLLRVQSLDAGTAPPGGHDMLNYVLGQPGRPERACVITEGLTPTSVFRRYLDRHGPGVHHVAFAVDDMDAALDSLRDRGVGMTSEEPIHDPLTGLRQVFLDRRHGGYFVELIERTRRAGGATFTRRNMAGLARTMERFVPSVQGINVDADALTVMVDRPRAEVLAYLASPGALSAWSRHRTVRCINGRWVDVRADGDIPVTVEVTPRRGRVTWRWHAVDQTTEEAYEVRALNGGRCARVRRVPPCADTSTAVSTLRALRAALTPHGDPGVTAYPDGVQPRTPVRRAGMV